MRAFIEKPDADLTEALMASMDALRMAEKLIQGYGQPDVADFLRLQAERNLQLLNQTVGLL